MRVYANPAPGMFRPVFSCAASECQLSKEKAASSKGGRAGGQGGGGRVAMKCAQSECVPLCVKGVDSFCIDLMVQLLGQIGKKGTMDLVCEADGTSCVVHENVLDAYFSGILYKDCHLGECVGVKAAANLSMEESR